MLPTDYSIIRESAQAFATKAIEMGYWLTPNNHVGTPDAARLMGITPGHMRNLISQGKGPPQHGGGGGFKKTVSLLDLAEWDYSRRHG